MRAAILVPLLLGALAAAPSAAVGAAGGAARTVEVRLTSFDFTPSTIRLRAGEPIVLHLVNAAGGGHDFTAPQFFAAASGVSGPVTGGRVALGGHASADVRLTPARGTYRLRCSHTLHSSFGMTGSIVVE
jgi:plastocyanin